MIHTGSTVRETAGVGKKKPEKCEKCFPCGIAQHIRTVTDIRGEESVCACERTASPATMAKLNSVAAVGILLILQRKYDGEVIR
jgi:hypothetical protein